MFTQRSGFVLSSDQNPGVTMKITKGVLCVAIAMLSACGGGGDSPVRSAQAATVPAGGFTGDLTGQNVPPSVQTFVKFGNAPFFDGALFSVDTSFPDSSHVEMDFAVTPSWTGNILFKNNTTGVSVVLSRTVHNELHVWQANSNPPNLIRNGVTDNFSVTLSN